MNDEVMVRQKEMTDIQKISIVPYCIHTLDLH